jgi:ribosomal protein S18 acetylase RimI-like enzyme
METVTRVPPLEYPQALGFLASGGRKGPTAQLAASAMLDYLAGRDPRGVHFFQATVGGGRLAAAMVLENPGRVGMLLHSPGDILGGNASILRETILAAALEAISTGLSLVQSLEPPQARVDIAVLESAGFEKLAELLYLKLNLSRAPASPDVEGLSWRNFGEFGEAELGELIEQTYRESLDCPLLAGLREMRDVIEGHKASGVFRPESWWIAEHHGAPAGCLLLNEVPASKSAEVVYVGVVPSMRGKHIASAMISRAACEAREFGADYLTLAVDSRNAPARRLYEKTGFQAYQSRIAYLRVGRKRAKM